MMHARTDLTFASAGRTLSALACAAILVGGAPAGVRGQTADELSQQATDPTASLLSVHLIGDVRTSFHGMDDSGFEFRIQPVIPFQAFGFGNIMRVIVPYQMGGPGAEGLKTVSMFDLVLFEAPWGRWGIGPVLSLAEGGTGESSQFGLGPAVGAVWDYAPGIQLGIFNQNLIGDDLAISQFQPIASYQLGNGWSLSTGDLQFVYDWDLGDWTNVPLGFQLGLVQPIAGQPMRFSVAPQWNLRKRTGTPQSRILFQVTLLAPAG